MVKLPPLPSPTVNAIYAAYEDVRGDGFREHLGASLIGKSCERALWFDFRWATVSRHEGRILRLFETGQREEERLVRNLRATGATVLEVDPATGRQFRVEAHGGHFGGSLDGIAIGLREAPKTWHVLEFKTHSAKSFGQLVAKGVVASKPQHAAQMQIYMHLMGLTRAFYLAVCKDTDALYAERVEADPAEAGRLLARAKRIIDAARPPSRISEDPAWFECGMCDHHAVCHDGQRAPVNCRTCLHSTAIDGGWHCARYGHMPDSNDQRIACGKHLFIPDLVAGDIIDAGEDFVSYRMKDGSSWINDARDEEEAVSC
jgi:hypothetical protein